MYNAVAGPYRTVCLCSADAVREAYIKDDLAYADRQEFASCKCTFLTVPYFHYNLGVTVTSCLELCLGEILKYSIISNPNNNLLVLCSIKRPCM